jgi:signal peptidase I
MNKTTVDGLVLQAKKEALEKGYELSFSIRGASMFPLLRPQDIITVVKCNCKELKPGNLILFKPTTNNDTVVVHRLIHKRKNENRYTFITKGDFQFNYDTPIAPEDIIGKVIKIRTRGRSISLEGTLGEAINKAFLLFSLTRLPYFIRKWSERPIPGDESRNMGVQSR